MFDKSPAGSSLPFLCRSILPAAVVPIMILLIVLMIPAPATWAGASLRADVTGTWDLTVESQGGTAYPSITLKQDGERISGTYQGQIGKSNLEGTVKGSDISFTVTLKFQDAAYTVSYSGTVSGDSMKGTARFGDAGTGNWSAKRRK